MYDVIVRTTIDLDEDVLQVAKQLARQRDTTIGHVLTELARNGLEPKRPLAVRNGVPLFTPRPGAKRPHLDLVNRLRDET